MVIAATVGHVSVSGLSEPVTYTMPLVNSSSFYSCVYWDELGLKLLFFFPFLCNKLVDV
jgi:hypothetical protein